MFVAGLVDEILRKIDQTRRRHHPQHNHDPCPFPAETYQSFMARQGEQWTPPELFEKCCARWLAGGGGGRRGHHHDHDHQHPLHRHHGPMRSDTSLDSLNAHRTLSCSSSSSSLSSFSAAAVSEYHHCRLKNGQWACNGGCNKLHPTVTLFFDSTKQKTLAVLSCRLDPFIEFFDTLVDIGVAVCKTPYLYELDGYLRQNLHCMIVANLSSKHCNVGSGRTATSSSSSNRDEKQQYPSPSFESHLVKVALGAMQESDAAQRSALETKHRHNHLVGATAANQRCSELFDDVLDVCLLNDLEDNLDVLTLHCMTRTNVKLRKVATAIIQRRLKDTQLIVLPHVDGFYLEGYSVFRRKHTQRRTIIKREHGGRMVEYAVCPPIICRSDQRSKNNIAASFDIGSKTQIMDAPSTTMSCPSPRLAHNKLKFLPSGDVNDGFDWACDELSFANLERDWGDICVHEYIGQNVGVYWCRPKVDTVSCEDTAADTDLPIFNVRLGTSQNGSISVNEFKMPHFSLTMDVEQKDVTQVDEVTVRFGGKARIVDCHMDFLCLVAMYARSFEPRLISQHNQIKTMRPLLSHEVEFYRYVQRASTLCSCTR